MRIIGGHDYYDTAFAYGRDTTLVYNRGVFDKMGVVSATEVPLRRASERQFAFAIASPSRHRLSVSLSPLVVWFAGKRYAAIELNVSGYGMKGYDPRSWERETEIYWTTEDFQGGADKYGFQMRRRGVLLEDGIRQYDMASLSDFFEDHGRQGEQDWLIENGHAIARQVRRWEIGEKEGWAFDCDGLKNIGFAKVLDAFAAFQELSMFVGGVLSRPGPEMVEIKDEKSMVAKKGFDHWSFRKMPASARS